LHDFPKQHSAKQLLLASLLGDITQKHPTFRFIFTTDQRGEWNRMMTEGADMADVFYTWSNNILEQTVEKREKAYGLRRIARLLQLWRRTCVVSAEWDSRAFPRERLISLNDYLLADIGLRREKQIVEVSKLSCWLA
jgi:uncharacterized protein YjiS (DUF1127 family)